MTVAGQAKVVNNHILIPETDNVTVKGTIFFYKNPLEILMADVIGVSPFLGGGANHRVISMADAITVTDLVNNKRPAFAFVDAIGVSAIGSGGAHSREQTVLQQVFAADQALARSAVTHESLRDRIVVSHVRTAQGPIVTIGVADSIAVQQAVRDTAPRHERIVDDILLSPTVFDRPSNLRKPIVDQIQVSDAIRKNIVSLDVAHAVAIGTRAWTPEIEIFSRIHVSQDPRRMFEQTVAHVVDAVRAAEDATLAAHGARR